MTSSELWSDGTNLAGHLHDIFCVEVSTAIGGCTNCGHEAPMTEARVFDHTPGTIARCQGAARSSCGWSRAPTASGWTYAA